MGNFQGAMRILAPFSLLLVSLAQGLAGQAPAGRPIPLRIVADRLYATPVTLRGDTLLFYLDTGGGANMVYERALPRLGTAAEWMRTDGDSTRVAAMPAFTREASIPAPGRASFTGERLMVFPAPNDETLDDGFLGRTWFADRIWVIDYPAASLSLLEMGASAPAVPAAHRVPLGFKVNATGQRMMHFPRIRVEIDGDSLDLLFDTGAMVVLTDPALAALGDGGPRIRGTSFIAENVFNRWRRRHPGWRVIEHADRTIDMPMIEVPHITLGGHQVGPVWFTVRPDRSFHEYMSQWMDQRIEGALGGSAFKYFRITLDYPRATAGLARP
ncbi:MAG: hypothetical protein HOP28_07005 [Gemmatimonadales bacterium]|nr:hypothetical protein [Gemmatimonadales bacterium]